MKSYSKSLPNLPEDFAERQQAVLENQEQISKNVLSLTGSQREVIENQNLITNILREMQQLQKMVVTGLGITLIAVAALILVTVMKF